MSTDNIHPASASIHVYMPILLASWPSEGMYVEGMYADPYSWYSARLGLADAISRYRGVEDRPLDAYRSYSVADLTRPVAQCRGKRARG